MDVARHAAVAHAELWSVPVLREDHALCFRGLNGWPGPFTAYAERQLTAAQVLRLLDTEDPTGFFELGAVLALPDGRFEESISRVEIEVLHRDPPSGPGWDSVLALAGDHRTLSEWPEENRHPLFGVNVTRLVQSPLLPVD